MLISRALFFDTARTYKIEAGLREKGFLPLLSKMSADCACDIGRTNPSPGQLMQPVWLFESRGQRDITPIGYSILIFSSALTADPESDMVPI